MEQEILYTVIEEQTCSIPFLTRRFSLTYKESKRVIEKFERLGVIGIEIGSKPRIINFKFNQK